MSVQDIKKKLMRYKPVKTAVYWRDYYRNAFAYRFMPEKALRKRFVHKCHYEPNFANPKTYNEKIQWLILNWRDPLARQCADKVAVREYVKQCGYEDCLIPLIGVYKKAKDVPFASLPNSFVLKGAHGSGFVCLCRDKATFDTKAALAKMRQWLRYDYFNRSGEWVYRGMPRRIVCETYLETEDGTSPVDYKIYCFHGEPKCVMVASGRAERNLSMDFFTPEWELMPFTRTHPNSVTPPKKPVMLDEMLSMARKLSSPFAHARVDLYCVKNHIWFGEITFFPASGMHPFNPFEYDLLFGSWLDLSTLQKEATSRK